MGCPVLYCSCTVEDGDQREGRGRSLKAGKCIFMARCPLTTQSNTFASSKRQVRGGEGPTANEGLCPLVLAYSKLIDYLVYDWPMTQWSHFFLSVICFLVNLFVKIYLSLILIKKGLIILLLCELGKIFHSFSNSIDYKICMQDIMGL